MMVKMIFIEVKNYSPSNTAMNKQNKQTIRNSKYAATEPSDKSPLKYANQF